MPGKNALLAPRGGVLCIDMPKEEIECDAVAA